MANTSIYNAFERMWLHIVAAIGAKADRTHASYHSTEGLDPITPEMIGALSGVDETLTQSGQAADAKVVGDAINGVVYTGEDAESAAETIDADTLGGIPAEQYASKNDLTAPRQEIILSSPNKKFSITIDDTGTLIASEIEESE